MSDEKILNGGEFEENNAEEIKEASNVQEPEAENNMQVENAPVEASSVEETAESTKDVAPATENNIYNEVTKILEGETEQESVEVDGVIETSYSTTSPDGNVTNGYEWNPASEEEVEKPQEKAKKSGKGFKVFAVVMISIFTLSSVLLCALVAANLIPGMLSNDKDEKAANTSSDAVSMANPGYIAFNFDEHDGKALSIPEIAAKCTPSSVGIISEIKTSSYSSSFFYFMTPGTTIKQASGSGFIYSADGYVITNHHVIEDASKITVILHDNTEYEATLIGSDEISDIAVLKITPDKDVTLVPMEIGDSDALVVGEDVVAIGCPAGIEFIGTVTDGIVSAINRNVEIMDSYGDVQKTMTLIQTNATINHGNSGGPLINTKGQVIGINTLKLSANYEGIGFSIPMNGAKPIISQLIEHGKVVERTEEDFAYGKGIIGINGTAISENESEYYGIPRGVLVVQINREGSASRAGLRRGDIITHYNGKAVTTVDELNALKESARAGTEVTLTVYRDGDSAEGETIDITFNLDAQ